MRRIAAGILFAGLAMAAGCARHPYMTPERLAKGLVIVLPGIEGEGPLNHAICDGLNAGGVDWGIDLEDWTTPFGPLYNLRAEIHNRQEATQIAMRVAEYKFANPDKPVVLVGHSGGGAIALWIAEAMPEGQNIDGIILLAPAISPGYMVDFALSKTSRGVLNFYSQKDWFFLGLGTYISGTMDGEHTSSAGRIGFFVPTPHDRPKVYDRLFQIPWHEQMAAAGYTGGHLSSSEETFVRHYVAPFVLADKWNEALVRSILTGSKVGVGRPSGAPEGALPPAHTPVPVPVTQPAPKAIDGPPKVNDVP